MKFNSIKFEIGFLYTVILSAIFLGFTVVLYFILSFSSAHELDYNLSFKAQEISSSIGAYVDMQKDKPDALKSAARAIISQETRYLRWWWVMGPGSRWVKQANKIDIKQCYVNLINVDGNAIASSKNIRDDLLALLAELGRDVTGENPVFKDFKYQGSSYRLINDPLILRGKGRYVIQVAIASPAITQLLQSWLNSMVLFIPLILLLSIFVGWLITTRFLTPVNQIINTARKITSEDLGSRVQEKDYAIEMKSLVEAFNAMIERLEKSFNHIEEFSSHVAHELKTPLTVIRGETELALMKDRKAEEYRAVLKTVGEESERMISTIDDLLYLSKLDYQPYIFQLENVSLRHFLQEIMEQIRILASAKHLKIRAELAEEPLMMLADRLHLRRLFFNLFDNAIKFTPDGGWIEIKLHKSGPWAEIVISDSGKGISEENLHKIFEKFFREDHSLSYGHGLGLSIVQAIVKVHHGHIDVKSQLGVGTTFTLRFPLLQSS